MENEILFKLRTLYLTHKYIFCNLIPNYKGKRFPLRYENEVLLRGL